MSSKQINISSDELSRIFNSFNSAVNEANHFNALFAGISDIASSASHDPSGMTPEDCIRAHERILGLSDLGRELCATWQEKRRADQYKNFDKIFDRSMEAQP